MMQHDIINWDNEVVGKATLEASIFETATRPDIIHRIVRWQHAKRRAGTHSTKDRGTVSGSTRKIYNQKGGGRARHGSIKAPIFIGGGITFGPHPRSHAFSLNKKVRNLGLKSILATKKRENNLVIMKDFILDDVKTSAFAQKIEKLGFKNKRVLMVDIEVNHNLRLSSANLFKVDVLPTMGINVLDLIKHEKVILTQEALEQLQARLKK